MTSFLQSEMWADFQRSIGRKVFRVGETHIIKHDLPFGKNYLYVPYVSQMSNDELRMTNQLANDQKSIFVKIEPLQDELARALIHHGYKKSSKNIQPHRTVVLDLTRSEDELLGSMHHKTRYNIRVAERNSVTVRQCRNSNDELRMFWDLMQKTTKRDQFHSYGKEYYAKLLQMPNISLWVAEHDGRALAAAIILTYGHTVYYLHGASDHAFRNLMAPYALHWNIISSIDIRNSTFRIYDFWGIDSVRWPGVTRFKLGFGGRTIEYPGAFDLTLSRLWYTAYNLFR